MKIDLADIMALFFSLTCNFKKISLNCSQNISYQGKFKFVQYVQMSHTSVAVLNCGMRYLTILEISLGEKKIKNSTQFAT